MAGNIIFDGKTYAFDIDRIAKSVIYADKTATIEKEIVTSFDSDVMKEKTIRELTGPGNAQIDNIKYDLIKTFILQVISYEGEVFESADMPFGTKLAFDTLINEKFLKEV